jgi:hypothetical protein
MVYQILENVYVSPYVKWALLWINMAANPKYLTGFDDSLLYRTSRISVKWFIGYVGKSICY